MTTPTTTVLDCLDLAKNPPPGPGPDLTAVKTRQQAMWASGDFAVIGTRLQIVGETLCEAAELQAGSRVLDVACGNGNAALAAARCFCEVTGVDYVPALLEGARRRADADGLPATFVPGDAEALPFEDGAFDTVLSTFGVMFAPDQARAARELRRVCARGGKIALASWTPEGFVGGLLRAVGRHVPPPAGVKPSVRWGTEDGLRELFGDGARLVRAVRRPYVFRFRSADHFIDVFRRYYGPTHKAFESLPAAGQDALTADLRTLIAAHDTGGAALNVPAEYLEAVLTAV